jgi:hypothetical protein
MNTITARGGTTINLKDLGGGAEEVAESGAQSHGGQGGDRGDTPGCTVHSQSLTQPGG